MIADFFRDLEVSATVRNYTDSADADGENDRTPVDTGPIKGVMYTASAAGQYFTRTWGVDVTAVFATDDIGNVTDDSFLVVDGEEFAVDNPDNIASQGELYVIGLKGRK